MSIINALFNCTEIRDDFLLSCLASHIYILPVRSKFIVHFSFFFFFLSVAVNEDPEEEFEIPDPGSFYPQPPNLPPPDNIIRPELPPDDTLPWELPQDFDEDNGLMEEQTNGVDMMNHFNKRYQYLKVSSTRMAYSSLEIFMFRDSSSHSPLTNAT